MSPTVADPLLSFDQNTHAAPVAANPYAFYVLSSLLIIVFRNWPLLLIFLGAWAANRKNQARLRDLDMSIAQLSTKMAGEREKIAPEFGTTPRGLDMAPPYTPLHRTRVRTQTSEFEDLSLGIIEIEERVVSMGSEIQGTRARIGVETLLGVTRRQEERLEELEDQVHSMALKSEGMDCQRRQERERFEEDIRQLHQKLDSANKTIAEVESRIVDLEAEADLKDNQVAFLLRERQELTTRVATMERPLASLNTGGKKNASTQIKSGKERSPPDVGGPDSRFRPLPDRPQVAETLVFDAQMCAQYEARIAELTRMVSECHTLLRTAVDEPFALQRRSVWDLLPPYEQATTPSSRVQSAGWFRQ